MLTLYQHKYFNLFINFKRQNNLTTYYGTPMLQISVVDVVIYFHKKNSLNGTVYDTIK